MPTFNAGFWIIEGWVSRAEMYVSGLQVTGFPVQTDQNNGRVWVRPGNTADVLAPARLVDTPLGTRKAYGGLIFGWPMVNMSPQMVKYLHETYFSPNGAPSSFFTREYSNKLTIQTFNRGSGNSEGNYETYHVYGRFANYNGEAVTLAGGYSDLLINYTAFAVAPLGPDVFPSVTPDVSATEFIDFDYVVTLTNQGDEATFGNTTLTFTVPSIADFVSISTGVSSTIEYSEDGGDTYSGTAPVPISNTTHVRATISDEIDISEVTGSFTFTVNPNTTGDMEATFVGTTQGDQETTNDTVVSNVTVVAFDPDVFLPAINLDAQEEVYSAIGTLTLAGNSDPIEQWNDQSGNSEHADQTNIANRPIYLTGQANGLNAVSFNGLDEWFDSVLATGTLASGDITAFLVVDPTTIVAGQEYLFTSNVSPSIMAHKADTGTNDELGFFYNGGLTGWEIFGTAQTGLQLITFKVDGTSISAYRDGTLLSTQLGDTVSFGGGFTIGADIGGLQFFYEGLLYELYIFDSALDDTSRGLVETFLINKYAIP